MYGHIMNKACGIYVLQQYLVKLVKFKMTDPIKWHLSRKSMYILLTNHTRRKKKGKIY